MKAAALLMTVVATFASTCSVLTTCSDCIANTLCGWYKVGAGGVDFYQQCEVLADVANNTAKKTLLGDPLSLCDACQAGSCAKCITQNNCSWYKSPVYSTCGATNSTNAVLVQMTKVAECPACAAYTTCETCSVSSGCGWYTDLLGDGVCSAGVPDFTKSFVPASQCTLKCDAQSCNDCQGNGCTWLTPKSTVALGVSSRCTYNTTTATSIQTAQSQADAFLYTTSATCIDCSANDCDTCQAMGESCTWYTGPLNTFGQCGIGIAPKGKTAVEAGKCSGACGQYKACSDCNAAAADKCQWFSPMAKVGQVSLMSSKCNFKVNPVWAPGTDTLYSTASTCPKCAATTCAACGKETDCAWFQTSALKFTGVCNLNNATYSTKTLVDPTSDKCTPSFSGVSSLTPALLAVLAMFAAAF